MLTIRYQLLGCLALCGILTLTGCTTAKTISTPESKQLAKQLKQDFEQLKKVEFQVFTSSIEWILTWGEPPNEADTMAAFEKIRQYVQTDAFITDVVEDIYLTHYARNSTYPSVNIIYDINNDKQYDQQFSAELEDATIGYVDWYYSPDWTSSTLIQ